MKKSIERYLAFVFGVVFVVVLLVLATRYPNPTPFQYTVFRIVLALASGGVAAMIPGFLTVQISTWLRAGGAIAVFVITYFYSPAGMTGVTVKTEQQQEIEKPVVLFHDQTHEPPGMAVLRLQMMIVHAESSAPLPNLAVTHPDQLLRPEVLGKRYQSLTIDGVRAQVPDRSTVVANEIAAIHGGSLVGSDFSVVGRHMANLTIDVSGSRGPGASPGSVRLYVKLVENCHFLANGVNGAPGTTGAAGANGADGGNGSDGKCDGFGGYRGANPGGNGGDAGSGADGQPGGNGQNGGLVVLTTIVNPLSTIVDIAGGQPGTGGLGGPAGTPGRGGSGGLGCTGLGGSQPNQANGLPGRPGQTGHSALPGHPGTPGEYRLQIVRSFDSIVEKIKTLQNVQLHTALQTQ